MPSFCSGEYCVSRQGSRRRAARARGRPTPRRSSAKPLEIAKHLLRAAPERLRAASARKGSCLHFSLSLSHPRQAARTREKTRPQRRVVVAARRKPMDTCGGSPIISHELFLESPRARHSRARAQWRALRFRFRLLPRASSRDLQQRLSTCSVLDEPPHTSYRPVSKQTRHSSAKYLWIHRGVPGGPIDPSLVQKTRLHSACLERPGSPPRSTGAYGVMRHHAVACNHHEVPAQRKRRHRPNTALHAREQQHCFGHGA